MSRSKLPVPASTGRPSTMRDEGDVSRSFSPASSGCSVSHLHAWRPLHNERWAARTHERALHEEGGRSLEAHLEEGRRRRSDANSVARTVATLPAVPSARAPHMSSRQRVARTAAARSRG
eukprot:scaffold1283_cov321-Prasinococcus_capsulatus_cf.AAC.6